MESREDASPPFFMYSWIVFPCDYKGMNAWSVQFNEVVPYQTGLEIQRLLLKARQENEIPATDSRSVDNLQSGLADLMARAIAKAVLVTNRG